MGCGTVFKALQCSLHPSALHYRSVHLGPEQSSTEMPVFQVSGGLGRITSMHTHRMEVSSGSHKQLYGAVFSISIINLLLPQFLRLLFSVLEKEFAHCGSLGAKEEQREYRGKKIQWRSHTSTKEQRRFPSLRILACAALCCRPLYCLEAEAWQNREKMR